MLNQRYAAIDQGTTGTRVVVFDESGRSHSPMSIPHKQITLNSGWVEQDPEEILGNIVKCLASCEVVDAIGICHQGESIVAWHADTKHPLYNAIIWQDMRTEKRIQQLKDAGLEPIVQSKSGLPLDPYFSASKMNWIIENIVGVKELAAKGKLRIGTMDSFFLDRLCGVYCTDYNSASRTSLFNIHTLEWDSELCEIFNVPIHCLAPIRDTTSHFGNINLDGHLTPVTASIVDQFAGTYGHGCRHKGDAKVTFGTGAFLQSLTGTEIADIGDSGLLPTLCWKFPDSPAVFGLDGGVYNAASAINWARKIGLFNDFDELDSFWKESAISRGLAFVPALSGLGCPYWDRSAAGIWTGLSLDVERKDMLQSVLEGIAVRSAEVILAMDKLSPLGDSISVDGGLSSNTYFKQFLANIIQKKIVAPANREVTALGTAMLARKGFGLERPISFNTDAHITTPNDASMFGVIEQYQDIISRSRGLRHS
ncbi:FGGY family carbohydrate kinase [Pragia fontium]|uniref:ATP:glycerol 3-phosphotransferase n=1 Tax=Pragia fontium DSM 5563 = ATCC 49100 TaxID=1122977 RepID=A0AAJ5BGW6_9GAMM|nr:FGGY family carbohydrate kinase [Pragia fontium]SFC66526.1 glycerol kinase [Pragia fontium DSM 5563 = ATCC 49100]VEJ56463.1 Glycerol kinase [Pragia fontium]